MTFDVESFYDLAVATLKDNIDAKIDSLNAEKADAITLKKPEGDDYYPDFNEKMISKTFFISYGIVDAQVTEVVGEDVSIEVTMHVYVGFVEVNGGVEVIKQGLRYTRALHEIFTENFDASANISNIEIFQYMPQSAQFEKNSKWYKIGGIEIKGTIST